MKNTMLTATIALAATAFGCANATHQATSPQRGALACSQLPADSNQVLTSVLTPGATFNAKPITETKLLARAHQPKVTLGAEVELPAPESVTQEYLERVLTCHAHTGVAAHSADPFHPAVGKVRDIDVKSRGATLAIQIRGSNAAANRDIWQRAQSLTTPATDVKIEQVGQATAATAF